MPIAHTSRASSGLIGRVSRPSTLLSDIQPPPTHSRGPPIR
jgi:hypothetical protein